MHLIDKKKFLKRFSTRKDAIAAIDFFSEMITMNVFDPVQIAWLKDELIKEDDNDLPKQVIQYLNEITGSNFRQTGHVERIVKKIPKATLDQFKSIILFKWEKWGGDEVMSQYLTPATLFGSTIKFNNYLDEATSYWIGKAKQQAFKNINR